VAHFTLFGPTKAEPLHGHNYRISLEVEGDELDEPLLADTDSLKRRVRELCNELDDKVLLPSAAPGSRSAPKARRWNAASPAGSTASRSPRSSCCRCQRLDGACWRAGPGGRWRAT